LMNSRNEGLFTPPSLRGSISTPGHNGGANWGMAAVNPTKGFFYVITKEQPTLDKLQLPGPGRGGRGGPPADASAAPPAAPAAPVPAAPTAVPADGFIHYASPVNFIVQSGGLSAMGPPWSNLTAYDLNTGTIRWQVPNGGVTALEKEGHKDTGARDPRGGPVVTAGGLIFAATASDHKVRAYDEDNGKVLWEYELPTGSDGVPAVYELGGREYIAFCVAAGDGLSLGGRRQPPPSGPSPNAYVVFALPKK
jgi:glucose dehydrogenase